MSRIGSTADITYPPELLPVAAEDDDVEIVVCLGPPACNGGAGPCERCKVIVCSRGGAESPAPAA